MPPPKLTVALLTSIGMGLHVKAVIQTVLLVMEAQVQTVFPADLAGTFQEPPVLSETSLI